VRVRVRVEFEFELDLLVFSCSILSCPILSGLVCCIEDPDLPNLEVGPDGKLTISTGPSCVDIVFMLPNFLFLGCCLPGSQCFTLEFDDVSRRVKLSRNPGYLFCLKRTDEFSYEEIGNIGFTSLHMRINSIMMYSEVLVLRDGRTFVLNHVESHHKIQRYCAQLHRFIFGRNNPNYIVPTTFAIIGSL
jgi:hypothetical protein